VSAYGTKQVAFRFRGLDFTFTLSQGLFSSADIDTGSRFLLKVLSQRWDTCLREGQPLPRTVLDAGCGAGVLGICAARALAAVSEAGLHVRAQDRDELARAFTEYNAAANMGPADLRSGAVLSAHTEPLLAGPAGARWDLILSNIPAKTGEPVLLDFIARSAGLLNENGSVMVVVVNTLADLLRSRITELALPLRHDESGREHTVLVYGGTGVGPKNSGEKFLRQWPCYLRRSGDFELEDIGYHIDAFQGVAGFDNPGSAVTTAARLTGHIGPVINAHSIAKAILVHEPDQGHFPVWLVNYLEGAAPGQVVLSGRNILALEASRHNLNGAALIVPAVDILLSRDALLVAAGMSYGAVFLFPDLVPRTNRIGAYWEGLGTLLETGGIVVIALPSSGAERFDREKPGGFVRLGDYKRHGFRALGYKKR
jgi:hypothetical protein